MKTWLVTAEQMRALDRATIDGLGLPAALLMEHAGRAVADEVAAVCAPPARVAVVCGSGNNGGDGFVCARWLRERGHDARVYLAAGPPRAGGEAALHLAVYEKLGGPVAIFAEEALADAAVIVDALLGTGLKAAVKPPLAGVIEAMNRAPGRRVAVDLPSGMDADSGQALGVCVAADRTVTLAFAKVGLVSDPGFVRAGELRVADIGIPRSLAEKHGIKTWLPDDEEMRTLVPGRSPSGHKGTYGHLLCVAGSPGKTGAALLTAQAGLRAGAGLVTLATVPAARPALDGRVLEVMLATVDLDAEEAGLAELAGLAEPRDAVAIGPGMPTSAAAGKVLFAALKKLERPLVIDADGLNHLARDPAALRDARAPVVLTPHPGEAARLLGVSSAEVQADRLAAARRLAERTGAVVVLKGARTVVVAPDERAVVNPTGNPGMATGGTGDVLTGVVGGLLAQGLDAFEAARLAVYVHGRAGDLARERRGQMGLIAGDVLDAVPEALRGLGG